MLSPNQIFNEPDVRVQAPGKTGSNICSLLLVDPDMPSPYNPIYRSTLYWMVNNIPRNSFEDGDFTVEYMPPDVTDTYEHRLVFLLFQHKDRYNILYAAFRF